MAKIRKAIIDSEQDQVEKMLTSLESLGLLEGVDIESLAKYLNDNPDMDDAVIEHD